VNARPIAYWTFTLVVAGENLGGAIWAALRIDYSRLTLRHLGCPLYLFNILGPGELLIAVALLLPGFPVAKQWAYARIGEICGSRWLVTLGLLVVFATVTLLTLPGPPQF
jgi:hypothetical protein